MDLEHQRNKPDISATVVSMADGGPAVLIVEDDPDVCTALKTIFMRAGYRVLTAANGSEAIDLTHRWRPDLMLLDVSMPGITGLDVCRIVRADPDLPNVAILMVSSWAFATDFEAGLAAGADGYLVKPFSNDEVLARAQALLDRRRQPTADGPA
jgi:DNA-binding response OmpR family regulator